MTVISEIQIDNQKVNSNIIEIECIKVIYFKFDYNIYSDYQVLGTYNLFSMAITRNYKSIKF